MAVLKPSDVERVEIPHEPGQWVELRRLRWREWEVLRKEKDPELGAAGLLKASLVKWSYPEPLTPESIDSLDVITATFLAKTIIEKSGGVDIENLVASLNGRTGEMAATR